MSQPIPPAPPEYADPKSAKAQAKAEKAYRKATRPFYKKKRFILLAVIALIVIIAVATSGGDDSGSSAPSSSGGGSSSDGGSSSGDTAKAVGLNQAVQDGKFEFTVTKQDCSKKSIGEAPVNKTAQGTFCIVSVTVKNIGNEAQLLDASSQKALDAKGREYSADSGAAVYLGDTNTFLNQLNPGSTVKGQIVYDVPVGTKLTKLELHDSPFSGGVTVNLG
jgi:hypothetical protein